MAADERTRYFRRLSRLRGSARRWSVSVAQQAAQPWAGRSPGSWRRA
nr:hypothetical protein [Verrucosispora sioxanthis]